MSSSGVAGDRHTGPIGPVGFSALLILLALSPLMRGGNRQVALILLEAMALLFLCACLVSTKLPGGGARWSARGVLVATLLSSPGWLAAVYLLPVPSALWSATSGRESYLGLLAAAGIPSADRLPLSLVPDATLVSLLAGIPLAAAFLAGYCVRVQQLKVILVLVTGMAFAQILLGLFQMAGGTASALYFGGLGGRPFGTFANPNHFANYLAMGFACYIWLAWTAVLHHDARASSQWPHSPWRTRRLLWIAGGVVLVLGVLMSRSRGAALTGLPAAMLAFALIATTGAKVKRWRSTILVLVAVLAAAIALVGSDSVLSRFELRGFAGSASFRSMLASSTLEGATQFWPWGAGWGTYGTVYPRFQPPAAVGTADYAHHDYAQLLFEGGMFAVLLVAAFGWLAASRAYLLVRTAMREPRLKRDAMAAAVCGLGLLGFLLHSFVEFNMHIPANAILACLLAGVFLRPLKRSEEEPSDD